MNNKEAVVYLQGIWACICSEDCGIHSHTEPCKNPDGVRCNDIQAIQMAIDALEKTIPKFHLQCLHCKKDVGVYSLHTMEQVGYTNCSYCEDCLRKGLALLKEQEKKACITCYYTKEENSRYAPCGDCDSTYNRWKPQEENQADLTELTGDEYQRGYSQGLIDGRVEMREYFLKQIKAFVGQEVWDNV